jgi:hypothetical protein
MNGQKFHLFDATIDLFDPFEVNSDCRNSDVKPLFLRVIVVICAYFQGPLAVTGGGVDPGPKGLQLSSTHRRYQPAYAAGDF